MRPDIFLATIGRGSNGSNALEVTEDRAAVTAESQDNIINRVNNVSQYGPSWHYVPGIGAAGTAYAEVPDRALGDLAFSRASSKTRTNAAGVVETIASNVPPHDYRNADGSLSTFPRLNLEPQRTNLVPNGLLYNASTGVAYNTAVSGSPMAGVNCARITKNEAAGTLRYANQNCSTSVLAGSTGYVLSAFFKYDGVDFTTSMEYNNATQFGGVSWFQGINIASTGITLGTSTSCTSTIENWGSGWYRVNVRITTGAAPSGSAVTYLMRLSSTLSTGQGFLHALPQLEAGAYPTTYIPTTTAAVTRLADTASKTGVSSLIGQTEGTVFLDLNYQAITGISMFLSIRPNSANKIEVYRDGTSIYGDVLGNSGSVVLSRVANPAGQYKIALAYKSGQTALYINGTSVGTSATAFSFTTSMADLFLNLRSGPTFVEQTFYNQAALFPTRLTNAQLAQMTTL